MAVLRFVFAAFALIGAADRIFGGRLKLGKEFENGILAAGALSLSMVGMICIAPTLSAWLTPVLVPVASFFKIDPAFFGGFIANDMGGASVAQALAQTPVLGGFHGLVVASMMGVTLCFTVPVSLRMIEEPYHGDVLTGILCGIATLPLGCFVGGIFLGLPFGILCLNLLPVLLVSVLTCIGLIFWPQMCCRIFRGIGYVVGAVITVGLAAGVFTHITGISLIPHMLPVADGFAIVCDIAIILSGIFPLIAVISKVFGKLLDKLGKGVGLDETSVLGLISSLANSIPTFQMIKKMNRKGRMMNMAFSVSAAFVLGDHMAFTMAFDESYLPAVVVGKLVSGLTALLVAHFVTVCRSDRRGE